MPLRIESGLPGRYSSGMAAAAQNAGGGATGLERTRRAIRGQPVDRPPTFPILLAPACQLVGVKQRDYNLDAGVMAETLLRARELCGCDGIYVSRDNWVYHQALGGQLVFPEDDESYSRQPLLASLREFRKLAVPDPESAPGMRTLLQAARRVVQVAGERYYVQANIDTGPFSLAAVLRGAQDFLLDLATEAEADLKELLSFCSEVVTAYGGAMIRTGVHGIQFGDSTASLVSPEHYARFALPYQERVLSALNGKGCDLWIHICGKTDHLLPMLRHLPFEGFEVDAKVDLRLARELLGERIALKGNLDTTCLLTRTSEEVHRACLAILRGFPSKTGLILSPGCGVPRMTPLENLRAMVRACEQAWSAGAAATR
jgi:MtaA/CmuA family methyltransferase